MKRKLFLLRFGKMLVMMMLLLTMALFSGGCSSGGGGNGGGGGGTAGGTHTFDKSGGTTTFANGVTMVVPTGAMDDELTVPVKITTEDNPPHAAPTGATIASKTFVITGVTYNFLEPVTVTIPYNTTSLGANDVPGVFFWDTGSNSYSMVSVKNIDTTAKTITFTTTHGGKYVAIGINGLGTNLGITGNVAAGAAIASGAAIAPVDTTFTAGTDGFFHPNFGAYDSPGGSCLGMANFAVWYFNEMKATDGAALYTKYREGDLTRWQDDLTARELISRAFMASSQTWAKSWMQKEYELGAQMTGYYMILGLKLSGPMTFLMADQWPGMQSGHATVVYKYDSGKFYIYDVNFPNEVVTIDWGIDTITGKYKFTNYTKNAAYNPQFTQFSFEGFATLAESDQYKLLYNGAKVGWSKDTSKFNTINITSATVDKGTATIAADGTVEISEEAKVTINGTVTNGLKTAKYIIFRLNGGQRYRVAVTGGAFTIPYPNKITLGTNTLMLVATDDAYNEWNAYAGFKEVPIKIKGTVFFTNAGFETGNFTGWYSERHLWGEAPGQVVPSDKSAIVSAGTDPIYPALNMVYAGNHSARINNYDNDLHISSVSQTATVPNAANPQAKFYWAAVMEQPNHDAVDQPYVDVIVKDDTAGTTLYSKHFYTGDPTYTGWLTFSSGANGEYANGGETIPWQTITLGFTQAQAGHQITATITAADCALSGHGAYIYLDGDE